MSRFGHFVVRQIKDYTFPSKTTMDRDGNPNLNLNLYLVSTVPFRIIRPPHDFFQISKNLRNSEKSRKKRIRGQKKIGGARGRPNYLKWQSRRFSDQCTGYLRHENRDDVIHLLFQFYYVDKLFTHKDLASEHLVGPGNGEKSKPKIGFFFARCAWPSEVCVYNMFCAGFCPEKIK